MRMGIRQLRNTHPEGERGENAAGRREDHNGRNLRGVKGEAEVKERKGE